MLVLLSLNYANITPLIFLMKAMNNVTLIGTNLSIIGGIIYANYWVFSKKPDSITISYWIIPCILFILCIVYCAMITIFIKNNSNSDSFY